MGRRPTLADVAQSSRVSPSTVSLVLRNRPGIPDETRQRVLQAAKELGYRPPGSRKGDYSHGLSQIGVVLKHDNDDVLQANPFYTPVIAGVEAACRQHGIRLLYNTMLVDEDNLPLEVPRLLGEQLLDGLLVVGALLNGPLVSALEAASYPIVLVDGYAAEPCDAVVTQNFYGAYRAISYLVRKGHRHIGLVGGHANAFPSLRERRRAYAEALQDHGIRHLYIADCSMRSGAEEAFDATARLLRQHPQITALFGCNDLMAIRAMQAAQALSRSLPDDLSVMGFDDTEAAHLVMPGLTTVQVDKGAMGRMAVLMLLQRARWPEMPAVVSALATQLIERQSVRDLTRPAPREPGPSPGDRRA